MDKTHTSKHKRSKTHKVVVTLGVAAVATLAFAALTWAVDDGEHRRYGYAGGMGPAAMRGGPMMGRFMIRALDRHLDLTDEQHASIEQIMEASHAEGQALRTDMRVLFEQLTESVEQEGFDEDRVRIMIENKSPQMVDMMLLRVRTVAEIRAQLTPEQQEAARELFDSVRGKFMR